jgi:hypothetical protein
LCCLRLLHRPSSQLHPRLQELVPVALHHRQQQQRL